MGTMFLDAGSNVGKALDKFMFSTEYEQGTVIHAFEPNPYLECDYPACVTVHRKAVWIENTKLPFYINKKKPWDDGASLLKHKLTGNLDIKHPVMVEAIDFSEWVKQNVCGDQYVILKMDIEGAEYKVLRKMIADGSIDLIDKLYLEAHCEKVHVTQEENRQLIEELKKHLEYHDDYIESSKIKEGKKRWTPPK